MRALVLCVCCVHNIASVYTQCQSAAWVSDYYGFWTSGQREDPCCCTGPWLWKLDALTNRSFSADAWVSSAWLHEGGEPNCWSLSPPPNDQETCVNILQPAAPFNGGGRWNDATCNFEMCALCEIEIEI